MDVEDIREKVSESYDAYFEHREEQIFAEIGDETPVELHRREIEEGTGNIFNIATEADEDYLIAHSDEIPSFHEFPYQFLIEYPINLTHLMKIRPMTVDHRYYWAWTAQVLSDLNVTNTIFELPLSQSIKSLIRLLLAANRSPIRQSKLDKIEEIATNKHLKAVSSNSLNIAAFNSYPVLEGLLKSICDDVITSNGEVREGERLHGMGHDYIAGKECSSLKDLLYHAENHAVESDVQSVMSDLREQISVFGEKEHAYEIIYDWRNSLLHGQNTFDIQAGIMVNLICVLVWNEIEKSRFEEQREEILEKVIQLQRMPDEGDRNIYPP